MIKKDDGGRPPIEFTAEQIAQVEALSSFLSVEQIAGYFGISRATFYNIRERDSRFDIAYARGRSKAIANIAQGVIKRALEGDNACSFFYLKTQAGWRETSNTEVHISQENRKTLADFFPAADADDTVDK